MIPDDWLDSDEVNWVLIGPVGAGTLLAVFLLGAASALAVQRLRQQRRLRPWSG